jgi:RNA-directed DNA polymerase
MSLFDWLFKRLRPSAGEPTAPSGSPFAPKASSRVPPGGATLDAALDVSPFAPLSTQEAQAEAGNLERLWGSAFFGRVDIIPPVSDPRTRLIDRAMVGRGLISVEELAKIHRVGNEMERLRPSLASAALKAQGNVEQARRERAELKKRKQEEAAERRRLRAEAIVRRKATDIVFLGRGVSKGLAERQSNASKLTAAGLPVFSTPADVAQALGVSVPRLRWLAFRSEATERCHYVHFDVPKKSGGVRRLAAPKPALAACQEWILRNILDKLPASDSAHGFVRDRGAATCAAPHVGKAVVVNLDLKDFFPSITFPRIRGAFETLGYSPAAATVLALLCGEAPRRRVVDGEGREFHAAAGPLALPQGSAASPALSNLVARRLDARLSGLARKLGWTYTRYADDLTFSADEPAAAKVAYLMARVRHLAQDEGFQVNEAKTRVQRSGGAQTVTGVIVNERAGVPRKIVRRLRAILHRAKFEGLKAQNRENHPRFEEWVQGMIAYVSSINPEQAKPLREAFEALKR